MDKLYPYYGDIDLATVDLKSTSLESYILITLSLKTGAMIYTDIMDYIKYFDNYDKIDIVVEKDDQIDEFYQKFQKKAFEKVKMNSMQPVECKYRLKKVSTSWLYTDNSGKDKLIPKKLNMFKGNWRELFSKYHLMFLGTPMLCILKDRITMSFHIDSIIRMRKFIIYKHVNYKEVMDNLDQIYLRDANFKGHDGLKIIYKGSPLRMCMPLVEDYIFINATDFGYFKATNEKNKYFDEKLSTVIQKIMDKIHKLVVTDNKFKKYKDYIYYKSNLYINNKSKLYTVNGGKYTSIDQVSIPSKISYLYFVIEYDNIVFHKHNKCYYIKGTITEAYLTEGKKAGPWYFPNTNTYNRDKIIDKITSIVPDESLEITI